MKHALDFLLQMGKYTNKSKNTWILIILSAYKNSFDYFPTKSYIHLRPDYSAMLSHLLTRPQKASSKYYRSNWGQKFFSGEQNQYLLHLI